LDLLAIWLVHRDKKSKVEFANDEKFYNDIPERKLPLSHLPEDNRKPENDLQWGILKKKLKAKFKMQKNKLLSFLGKTFEVSSCVAKIIAFFAVYGRADLGLLGVAAAYGLQTYLYIKSGGYAFFGHRTFSKIKQEYLEFQKTEGQSNPKFKAESRSSEFDCTFELDEISLDVAENPTGFSLKKKHTNEVTDTKGHKSVHYRYEMRLNGIATDKSVETFASIQNTTQDNSKARQLVMKEAHRLQLMKFQSQA
jgi:hypothetical protein